MSTGTSDKNEAQKQLPELAIKLKQKIADAIAILDADELRKEVSAFAAKLNRSAEFDLDNANASQLVGILQRLSTLGTQDVSHKGKSHLSNLKQHLSAHKPSVGRGWTFKQRNDEVKRVKSLLSLLIGVSFTKDNRISRIKEGRQNTRDLKKGGYS